MTRKEMIYEVKVKARLDSLPQAEEAIDAVFETIAAALATGDEYSQPGFGRFSVKRQAERQGRNPRTGEKITIAERKAVKLTVYPELKKRING